MRLNCDKPFARGGGSHIYVLYNDWITGTYFIIASENNGSENERWVGLEMLTEDFATYITILFYRKCYVLS